MEWPQEGMLKWEWMSIFKFQLFRHRHYTNYVHMYVCMRENQFRRYRHRHDHAMLRHDEPHANPNDRTLAAIAIATARYGLDFSRFVQKFPYLLRLFFFLSLVLFYIYFGCIILFISSIHAILLIAYCYYYTSFLFLTIFSM